MDGEQFQRFCTELVKFEASTRFVNADVDGPERKYVRDAGVDIYVSGIDEAPIITSANFGQSLIGDYGPICICCKTGTNFKSGLTKDMEKKGPIGAIRENGSVVCMINLQSSHYNKNNLLDDIRKTLAKSSGIPVTELMSDGTFNGISSIPKASNPTDSVFLKRSNRSQGSTRSFKSTSI